MSRKYNQVEKSPKIQTIPNGRTNVQRQNEEFEPTTWPKKIDNIASSRHVGGKWIQNSKDGRSGGQRKLPPIPPARSHRDADDDNGADNEEDFEIVDEDSLPLKLFAGKKQSLSELSEESMSYIWLRRIKEIFLRMGDSKDEQNDDPFVEFDMNLAKTDLANTCDRYIENERPPLIKKVSFIN